MNGFLPKLASIEHCTGCSACYSTCNAHAISMKPDCEGFLRPVIDIAKCVACRSCEKSCPEIDTTIRTNNYKKQIFACWNKNDKVRELSSSGGVYFPLAMKVIEQNGFVCGAIYKNGVMHILSNNEADIENMRGSKYVQSELKDIFCEVKERLEESKNILFSGTPCQVAGLRSYLQKEYDNLISVDLVCHGVCSPLIWQETVNELERKFNSIVTLAKFRSKRLGWRCQGTEIYFSNGKVYFEDLFHNSYFRGFLRNLILRPSCHHCSYACTNRPADITLGDFWGYKDYHGNELDDDKGISMVMINTKKGKDLFNELEPVLHSEERVMNDVIPFQTTLQGPFTPSPLRESFWKDFKEFGFDYVKSKYLFPDKNANFELFKISRIGRLLLHIRNKLKINYKKQ